MHELIDKLKMLQGNFRRLADLERDIFERFWDYKHSLQLEIHELQLQIQDAEKALEEQERLRNQSEGN